MSRGRYERVLRERMESERFQHSLRVADTAEALGKAWGVSEESSYYAGLLHDIARDYSGKELLQLAQAYGIVFDEIEEQNPILLHGPVGAAIVENELELADPEILEAIRLHTTGDYPLSPLAKVLFLADYIEPQRHFEEAEEAREAARHDLELGVAVCVKGILSYLVNQEIGIHPKTVRLYNHYTFSGVLGLAGKD